MAAAHACSSLEAPVARHRHHHHRRRLKRRSHHRGGQSGASVALRWSSSSLFLSISLFVGCCVAVSAVTQRGRFELLVVARECRLCFVLSSLALCMLVSVASRLLLLTLVVLVCVPQSRCLSCDSSVVRERVRDSAYLLWSIGVMRCSCVLFLYVACLARLPHFAQANRSKSSNFTRQGHEAASWWWWTTERDDTECAFQSSSAWLQNTEKRRENQAA